MSSTVSDDWEMLFGWGRTRRSEALIRTPDSVSQIQEELHGNSSRPIIPRGLGRSYGDASLNGGGIVLDMTGFRGIRSFDPLTGITTIAAGTSIAQLVQELGPHGWLPFVIPGTGHVTIGGAIASDIHGMNHHVDGSFCDHVVSIDMVLPTGERRQVSPSRDKSLFEATAGGMGLTGVIVEATVRLMPIQSPWLCVGLQRRQNIDDIMSQMETSSSSSRYCAAWVDCASRGLRLGRGILIHADHLRGELHERSCSGGRYTYLNSVQLPAPCLSLLASRVLTRTLNTGYFHMHRMRSAQHLYSLRRFFYPFDVAPSWNRLYGREGFFQYQFVVPDAFSDLVKRAIELVQASNGFSSVAVLKRFGKGRGMLSFPRAGWAFGLDLPARLTGLDALLQSLDELVTSAGGAVYLAKDARLRREVVKTMYPDLNAWRRVKTELDPMSRLRSDLDYRLSLSQSG